MRSSLKEVIRGFPGEGFREGANRAKYAYDRDGNRLSVNRLNSLGSSNVYTYDNLNRLTSAKVGKINTSASPPDIVTYRAAWYDEDWTLDKLGNWSTYQPLSASETRTHTATNEVNQVTTADVSYRTLAADDFSNSDVTAAAFTVQVGTWTVSSGAYQVSAVTSTGPTVNSVTYDAAMVTTGESDWNNLNGYVTVTWPSTGPAIAGLIFGSDADASDLWMVGYGLDTGPNSADQQLLFQREGGGWTLRAAYDYTTNYLSASGSTFIPVTYTPGLAMLIGRTVYDENAHGPGLVGLFASKAGTKFDNFKIDSRTQKESLNGRWFDYDAHWLTYESLGSLRGDTTNGYAQNSLAVRAGARARYFRYEVTLHQNLAKAGPAFGIRDPDNFFAVTWDRPSEGFRLYKVVEGHKPEVIAYHSTTYTQANRILRIEVTSSGGADYCTVTLDPYTTPVVLFNNVSLAAHGYTGGQFGAYCSFSLTTSAILDDTKLWIDASGGNTFDKQVFNDDFSSASATVTLAHDPNGNLTDDGVYQYVYDAWNRLVQVQASQGDHTLFATYTYDGTGRRVSKTLEHLADLDGTELYYYDGQKQIEMRQKGWYNEQWYLLPMRQYVWGTQYLDELIRMDINGDYAVYDPQEQGWWTDTDCLEADVDAAYYFHQDANYNVTAVTDAAGDVVQRISYSAYGRPSFTDANGRVGSGPTFGPGSNKLHTSAVAWQGLFNDLETSHSYNRARTLHHRLGRFMQRDPLGYAHGMGLCEYIGSAPHTLVDPAGLQAQPIPGVGGGTIFPIIPPGFGTTPAPGAGGASGLPRLPPVPISPVTPSPGDLRWPCLPENRNDYWEQLERTNRILKPKPDWYENWVPDWLKDMIEEKPQPGDFGDPEPLPPVQPVRPPAPAQPPPPSIPDLLRAPGIERFPEFKKMLENLQKGEFRNPLPLPPQPEGFTRRDCWAAGDMCENACRMNYVDPENVKSCIRSCKLMEATCEDIAEGGGGGWPTSPRLPEWPQQNPSRIPILPP